MPTGDTDTQAHYNQTTLTHLLQRGQFRHWLCDGILALVRVIGLHAL